MCSSVGSRQSSLNSIEETSSSMSNKPDSSSSNAMHCNMQSTRNSYDEFLSNGSFDTSMSSTSYRSHSNSSLSANLHHSIGSLCNEYDRPVKAFLDIIINASSKRLITTVAILTALKMNILFEQMMCLLTIIVARYTAHILRCKSSMNGTTTGGNDFCSQRQEDITLVSTASMNALVRSFSTELSEESLNLPSSSSISTATTVSTYDTPIHLNYDQHQTSPQPTEEDVISSYDNAPLTPTSFLPMPAQEDPDEWGHFTDFQDTDVQGSYLENSNNNNLSSNSNTTVMADPFLSLNKTIRRRRGEKLSVCKLEQLQEEEEEDDTCE